MKKTNFEVSIRWPSHCEMPLKQVFLQWSSLVEVIAGNFVIVAKFWIFKHHSSIFK